MTNRNNTLTEEHARTLMEKEEELMPILHPSTSIKEQEMTSAIYNAMVKFHEYQLDNIASSIERVVPSIMAVMEDIIDRIEEESKKSKEASSE